MNVILSQEAVPMAATWKDYIALTKPRVISLLLFTTLATMFVAADAQHHVTIGLFLAVALGGYAAAGAANAFNMVYDRDIDGRMHRTSGRPTVTRQIPTPQALLFAVTLTIGSFLLLWCAANLLTATMAMAGLLFYVLVYTMLLKRRTWHNIVIGGAAGSFPPLVGYAAVANHLTPFAWYLFALIFVWTPVHFWALALLLKEDYASAGIPMLPVVRGDRATVIQITGYTILTLLTSLAPFWMKQAGWLYLGGTLVLDGLLLVYCARLFRRTERKEAAALFHYSMLYLALLFLLMALDKLLRL